MFKMSQRASYLNYLSFSTNITGLIAMQSNRFQMPYEERRIWSIAILASLLFHAIVFAVFPGMAHTATSSQLFRVSLQPKVVQSTLIPAAKRDDTPNPVNSIKEKDLNLPKQIISQSSAEEKAPEQQTRFLSDKDSSTEKNQTKRGDFQLELPANKPGSDRDSEYKAEKKLEAQKKPLSKEVAKSETPRRISKLQTKPHDTPTVQKPTVQNSEPNTILPKSLFLSKQDMANLLANDSSNQREVEIASARDSAQPSAGPSQLNPADSSKAEFQATSDSRLSGFAASRGSSDYLPEIAEGEVTLLNAKANRYALFVRRVAEKVFGELRASHWRSLGRGDARRASRTTTIFATLSPTGKLLTVRIDESSGSTQFDQTVYQSIQNGAWDQNPPGGAVAADGNIHFVFQSQLRTQPAPTPSGEARWLILGTGLL